VWRLVFGGGVLHYSSSFRGRRPEGGREGKKKGRWRARPDKIYNLYSFLALLLANILRGGGEKKKGGRKEKKPPDGAPANPFLIFLFNAHGGRKKRRERRGEGMRRVFKRFGAVFLPGNLGSWQVLLVGKGKEKRREKKGKKREKDRARLSPSVFGPRREKKKTAEILSSSLEAIYLQGGR